MQIKQESSVLFVLEKYTENGPVYFVWPEGHSHDEICMYNHEEFVDLCLSQQLCGNHVIEAPVLH